MPTKPNDLIEISQFNDGGLASSKWSGVKNSLYRLIGHDPHTRPGVLGVEQKLTKISSSSGGNAVDELCKVGVNCSNGSVFKFSAESGKIWEIQPNGTVRLVHTTTPEAGEAKCLGAVEYQGKIIWATQSRLHYITVDNSNQNNWAAQAVEDWHDFDIADSEFHPMLDHTATLLLFIGDGNQLAQYDGATDTFSSNALDIREPLRIKSLGEIGTDVLLGTYIASTVTGVEILRWNTWDDSFASSDKVPEIGVNAFLPADNMVLVSAGTKGNLYWYDGTNLELFMRIPGDYEAGNGVTIHPYSVANKENQILFGVSNVSGNPAPQLIYRIARHSRDYHWIMDQPYPLSLRDDDGEFVLSGLDIGSIEVQGDQIVVSWKYGDEAGFDRLDLSNKLDGAYWETRVMVVNRETDTNLAEVFVAYASLPTGTDLDFYLNKNYSGYGSALSTFNDVDPDNSAKSRNVIRSEKEGTEFTTLQLKVKSTASGNSAPLQESGAVRIR